MRPAREFTLIAGPCALEDSTLNLSVAGRLARLSARHGIPVIFKASFDKANRSRVRSPRGPGLDDGLRLLSEVREETGLKTLTDIHIPDQAGPAAECADILQIPAFLCRQTDLILAAAATGLPLNIKKGQWMGPGEMAAVVEKARSGGASEVLVTERGTFFGYGNLVVDMRAFRSIRRACGVQVVFDGTHSVQRPGARAGSSGGNPEHIPALVRGAVAAGCDHLFLETHPAPQHAPSDGSNMLPLEALEALVADVAAIRALLGGNGGRGAPDEGGREG
ncbi:MAG: 3-deoxy-8-phosphooctulonate synthase [Gammaproteobacteria bacterium]|nr:3-deoxy-8-phosphooctulonate synthase [Gammaproteobacteria bacterium]MDE0246731.1 3-deoxy-8-phosphooctulonate synthase [Gammaproteobacteria bacterium]